MKGRSESYERKMVVYLRLGSLNINSEVKIPVQEVYLGMLLW